MLEAGEDAARVQLGHADGRMVRRYSVAADALLGQAVYRRAATPRSAANLRRCPTTLCWLVS